LKPSDRKRLRAILRDRNTPQKPVWRAEIVLFSAWPGSGRAHGAAAHKHPAVRAGLARHKRFSFHFTPTSCSWLNAVEGYFAKLSKQHLQRGVFRSVAELQTTIERFIAETNQTSRPFVWTADPRKIIAAVRRGHQMLDSIH
jgi:transposase